MAASTSAAPERPPQPMIGSADGADVADALEGDRQHALAGHAAHAVGQDRLPVRQRVAGADGVDGAEAVGAAFFGSAGDSADVRRIGCQLRDHRDIHGAFHRSDDFTYQFRILAHGHAVARGMGAGQVQLQAIGYGRQQFRHAHEFLDAAAEDRCEQEAILRHLECLEARERRLGTGIGQAHGIDETARRVLRIHRLAIAGARCKADALGGDDAELRHLVEEVLDDRRGGGDDARGNRERAREGLAEKRCAQGGVQEADGSARRLYGPPLTL
jgi:hypothetical protein